MSFLCFRLGAEFGTEAKGHLVNTSQVTILPRLYFPCCLDSILYKTKLPFIVAMNKIDIVDNKYAVEWMEDFEVFQVLT